MNKARPRNYAHYNTDFGGIKDLIIYQTYHGRSWHWKYRSMESYRTTQDGYDNAIEALLAFTKHICVLFDEQVEETSKLYHQGNKEIKYKLK